MKSDEIRPENGSKISNPTPPSNIETSPTTPPPRILLPKSRILPPPSNTPSNTPLEFWNYKKFHCCDLKKKSEKTAAPLRKIPGYGPALNTWSLGI